MYTDPLTSRLTTRPVFNGADHSGTSPFHTVRLVSPVPVN